MANYPLLRDPATNAIILPGRTLKVITWPFFSDTTLPAGLTMRSGTATLTDTSTSRGQLAIQNAASGSGGVYVTTGINLNYIEAVRFDVEGLWLDSSTSSFSLGLSNVSGSAAGLYMTQTYATAPPTALIKQAGGTTTFVNYDMFNGVYSSIAEYSRMRNISLMYLVKAQHAYLLEDDQVFVDLDMTGFPPSAGVINPLVQFTPTDTPNQHNMYVSQLRLTVSGF